MIDYNILDVGLWCEGKDFEEAELCYDIIREDFFDDIGGGSSLRKLLAQRVHS